MTDHLPQPDIDPLYAFRGKLDDYVQRQVQQAHADILQELAAKELELQQAKAQIEQLMDALAVATLEMNDLRGIPRPQFDENGVVVG